MDKKIHDQIDEISSSAIAFRNAIDQIIFNRLTAFFQGKGKDITRESRLKDLFGKPFAPKEWYELEDIELKIPELQRHKAFRYVTGAYVIAIITTWIIVLTNIDAPFVLWTVPLPKLGGIALALTLSPLFVFMAVFKKRLLPVDNIENLIDGIISENWSDLLADNKELFKEILKEELQKGPGSAPTL